MFSNPNAVTYLGSAFRRQHSFPFGIRQRDRLSHLYVIGQTGTGKSTLLENMIAQDIAAGQGLCLIDPHGDLASAVAASAGENVVYWDVADPASPYGYNPLTRTSAQFRPLVVSGLIDALKKQWADAWGVRMEHLLRYALLALLEQTSADLRDVMRLFIDKTYQHHVRARITDPQAQQFWSVEYPTMSYKTAVDGVAPIANKLGALLAHPVIRAALCEPKEPLRLRKIMDEGQVLIVDLAKGRIGADMANVVGGLLVASIMNAALTRHDMPDAERRPFMLYVDEFHSFTTLGFANLLSEVRKYGLGVTLAHQYVEQADSAVHHAIFGNVGSVVGFRVGPLDAPLIVRQLDGFSEGDLINLPNYQAATRLMVDGEPTKAFSAVTWPPQLQRERVSQTFSTRGIPYHEGHD